MWPGNSNFNCKSIKNQYKNITIASLVCSGTVQNDTAKDSLRKPRSRSTVASSPTTQGILEDPSHVVIALISKRSDTCLEGAVLDGLLSLGLGLLM